jgi:hypothetical protein
VFKAEVDEMAKKFKELEEVVRFQAKNLQSEMFSAVRRQF